VSVERTDAAATWGSTRAQLPGRCGGRLVDPPPVPDYRAVAVDESPDPAPTHAL